MKLDVTVTLNAGGTVRIYGDDLTAEAVNEAVELLVGHVIETHVADIIVVPDVVQ